MKEIIQDLDSLLKYAHEIEMVTGYKGIDRPNFQKIRKWILENKVEKESKDEAV